jgi:NAD-dependent SIR2 family protein deacetylase
VAAQLKRCKRCRKDWPTESYFKHHRTKDGRHPICPKCLSRAYKRGKAKPKQDIALANKALEASRNGHPPIASVKGRVVALVEELKASGFLLQGVAVEGRTCHVQYAVRETFDLDGG